MVCIFNFRLERTDFMPIHLSLPRPLARKTNDMVVNLTKATAKIYKEAENNLKEALILARENKLLLKEFDKTWKRNEKAKKEGLLTEKDCTKEKILAEKIDKKMELYYQKLSELRGNKTEEDVKILKFSKIFRQRNLFHTVDYNYQ